jgi:hypothetical protein
MDHQDEVAQQAIAWAKYKGAKSPREAAEMTAQRSLTEEQWNECKHHWERHWPMVRNPDGIVGRFKRLLFGR